METKQPSTWTKTIVASMTSYIDAGSIVAGGAGLVLWTQYLGMTEKMAGILMACSSNAMSAAVGALIGGYICDRYGRKLVYTYDLVFYILGMLLVVFAVNFPMLLIGYSIVGLSVGADVVASWTLIAENAPAENRARHCGSAQVAWALGPAVVLMLSAMLGHLGLLGNRIVFAHLIVVALITWILRLRMPESDSWVASKEKEQELIEQGVWHKPRYRDLFVGPNLRAILFLLCVYTVWNLAAGTWGSFFQYLYVEINTAEVVQTLGAEALENANHPEIAKAKAEANQTANLLSIILFVTSCFSTLLIFMQLADRFSRRLIFAIVASLFVAAWALLLLPAEMLTLSVFVLFAVFIGINNGSGQQAFYQMWASEMFPARYRATAQGFMFFTARICLGCWLAIMPVLLKSHGVHLVATILMSFAAISMIVGTLFTPNTRGKTLEQIEEERHGENA